MKENKHNFVVGDKVKVLVKGKYWFRGEIVSITGDKINVVVSIYNNYMIVETSVNEVWKIKEIA